MKIGDKVWIIDENRRVYIDDEGNKHSSPILRKKFVEWYIIGETRVSWILSYSNKITEHNLNIGKKVKKVDADRIIYTSEEEIEQCCWINENRYKISEKLRFCDDYNTLKKINELLSEIK